jgi:regulatory protein
VKQSVSARAVSLLANREHSALELSRKLQNAGFDTDEVEKTLHDLQQANLQSDERFTENYLRSRANKGYGELRIRNELKERGVASELISECLYKAEIDWFSLAVEVRCKRFGESNPEEYKERAKQQRFLQYRGFSHEQITESFNPQ